MPQHQIIDKERDNSIDIARGIAILGVLYGHAMAWQDIHGTMLVHWFWSFHMALFALVSGYFYRKKSFWESFVGSVKNLLVPLFVVSFVLFFMDKIGGVPFPSLDAYIRVSEKTFPIHIINSISGTAFVIYVSKLTKGCKFLQTLGKGTLLLYLGNGLFQTLATKTAYALIPTTTYLHCLSLHVFAYILCISIGLVAVKIVYGSRYLSWIVGKY